jgi:signal transduction histidine kinase
MVVSPHNDDWDAMRGQIDRTAIEQVLVNLLGNAVKYGQPTDGQAATIQVGATSTAEELIIHVADLGRGIPVGEHERVFERFHRVWHGDLSHVAGTGLGLYLVRQLAVAHGGSARVVSTEAGCVIEVRVPKVALSTIGTHHDPLGWDPISG